MPHLNTDMEWGVCACTSSWHDIENVFILKMYILYLQLKKTFKIYIYFFFKKKNNNTSIISRVHFSKANSSLRK